MSKRPKKKVGKTAMQLPYDVCEQALQSLNDEELGRCMRDVFNYEMYGDEVPEEKERAVAVVRQWFCDATDVYMIKYEKMCARNAENARGGKNKEQRDDVSLPVAPSRSQSLPVEADTDTDTYTYSDTYSDTYTYESDTYSDKDRIINGVDSQHTTTASLSSVSEISNRLKGKIDNNHISEVASIIDYFLNKYTEKFGRPHPEIDDYHLGVYARVIEDPYPIKDRADPDITYCELECCFADYKVLIDNYFDTQLNCDYTLFHFLDGDIRRYRYYETLY